MKSMGFKNAALLLALMWLQACASISDKNLQQKIKRPDGSFIDYYWHKSPQASELMIVLQGSDCNSVVHDFRLMDMAKIINLQADYLLVEKYGITQALKHSNKPDRADCPELYLQQDSIQQRADDILAVTKELKKEAGYQRIFLLGGSEGAAVAALVAAQMGQVAALVMINGGGRWFQVDVEFNISQTVPEPEKTLALDGFRAFAQQIHEGAIPNLSASNHGYQWWHSVLTLDLQATLQKVDAPVLVVQGLRDTAVFPDAVIAMVNELTASGKNHIDLKTYPLLDHGLNDSKGTNGMAQVAEYIAAWLLTVQPVSVNAKE